MVEWPAMKASELTPIGAKVRVSKPLQEKAKFFKIDLLVWAQQKHNI